MSQVFLRSFKHMQCCNRNETDEPDAAKLWITYDYIFEANASISKRRILTF